MIEKNLLRQVQGEKRRFFLLTGLALGGALLIILQADLIAQIIDKVFLSHYEPMRLQKEFTCLLGVMLLRSLHFWLQQRMALELALDVKERVRHSLLRQLLLLGPWPVNKRSAGEWATLLQDGVEHLEAYFARFLPQLLTAVLAPFCIMLRVGPLDPGSALLLAITAPLIPVFMVLIGRRTEKLSRKQWESLSRLGAHFLDVLQGLFVLKLFQRSREQVAVIARLSARLRESNLSLLRVAFLSALVLELAASISTAILAVTIGLRLVFGGMEFYQALFILLLAPEFYLPLRQLGAQFHAALAGKAAAQAIFSFLAQQPQCVAGGNASPNLKMIDIKLQGLHYRYAVEDKAALCGLTLEIAAGKFTALVGASGAGKSTIAGLLLGFDAPQRGYISINGVELNEICRSHWLAHVAYLPQEPQILAASLAENIALARPTASLEEIAAAAAAAGLEGLVEGLPQGYDTLLGDGNRVLSGGEARRVALARAFLQDAPLVILDEATSDIDPRQEALIEEAMQKLFAGRTVLALAHRLNTVRRADRIVVIEEGRTAESGRHEELLTADGKYAAMLRAFRGEA